MTEDRETPEVIDQPTGDQPGTDIVPVEPPQLPQAPQAPPQAVSLFGADPYDYVTAIERTSKVALLIKEAIVSQKMTIRIKGNDYVKIEGWQWLGSLLGIGAHTLSLEAIPSISCTEHVTEGYEAHVELRHMATGMLVSSAFAECSFHEKRWEMATDNELKSMAQTRATGKAWRQQFAYLMLAAGFEGTPAEEMQRIEDDEKDKAQPQNATSRAPRRENSTQAPKRASRSKKREESATPPWAKELKAKMAAVEGLDLDYVAMAIGVAKATTAEINDWLDANADYVNPLDALVAMAIEKLPPDMREKAQAAPGALVRKVSENAPAGTTAAPEPAQDDAPAPTND